MSALASLFYQCLALFYYLLSTIFRCHLLITALMCILFLHFYVIYREDSMICRTMEERKVQHAGIALQSTCRSGREVIRVPKLRRWVSPCYIYIFHLLHTYIIYYFVVCPSVGQSVCPWQSILKSHCSY